MYLLFKFGYILLLISFVINFFAHYIIKIILKRRINRWETSLMQTNKTLILKKLS